VTEWIYFIHPPRDDFAATMTADEKAAPDEQAARQFMEEDPVVRGGYARGEVRPSRVSLLRGRD
jgi:hypothetical protein